MNIVETNIRKNAHNFKVMVTDKGALVYAMDDNEPKHARALKDGKLYFIGIQEELEKISMAVEALQLWAEQMLATGAIDVVQYSAHKNKEC